MIMIYIIMIYIYNNENDNVLYEKKDVFKRKKCLKLQTLSHNGDTFLIKL